MHPTQLRLVVALVVTILCLPLLALDLLGGHGGGSSSAADVRTEVPEPSMVVAVSPSEVTTSSESTTSSTAAPPSVSAQETSPSTTKAPAPPKSTTTTTAPKKATASSSSARASAPPSAAATPAPAPPPSAGSTSTTSEASFLACVRHRESRGDYSVVDSTGTYMGAYQIYQGGWDTVARSIGRADLVGVRPNTASPADQDAVALAMLRQYGRSPWGGSCG